MLVRTFCDIGLRQRAFAATVISDASSQGIRAWSCLYTVRYVVSKLIICVTVHESFGVSELW